MKKRRRFNLISVIGASLVVLLATCVTYSAEGHAPGLVGAWFGESDLTNCKDADLVKNLDLSWRQGDDYGKEWSAKWQGFITAPATGQVTFHGQTSEGATVKVAGVEVIRISEEKPSTISQPRKIPSSTSLQPSGIPSWSAKSKKRN